MLPSPPLQLRMLTLPPSVIALRMPWSQMLSFPVAGSQWTLLTGSRVRLESSREYKPNRILDAK